MTRRRRYPGHRGLLYAWDIETARWDEYVLGVVVGPDGPMRMDSMVDWRRWYLTTGKDDTIIAHNGGRFDFLFAIDAIPRAGWEVSTAGGGSIVSARFRDHARLIDSYRLFPISLADWTGAKSQWEHSNTSSRMSDLARERLYRYCERDAEILRRAYLEWCEWIASIGLETHSARGRQRLTIGSLSYHTARAEISDEEPDRADLARAREGCYGGNTQGFIVRARRVEIWDINSAYPWALTLPVPMGRPRTYLPDAGAREYARGMPGIYRATVDIPIGPVPLLPMRLADERIVWTTGRIKGAWTDIELRWAESKGARIVSHDGALVYPSVDPIYREYVLHYYAMRADAIASGDVARAKWLKLLLNSLYGKLVEREDHTRLRIFSECPGDDWDPLDDAQRHWLSSEGGRSTGARPHQGAYVTARVRIAIGDALLADPGRAYCDTDAIYTTSDRRPPWPVHATDLGAAKHEATATGWVCLAPKLYAYRTLRSYVRARGVPKATVTDLRSLMRGDTLSRQSGLLSLRRALERPDGRIAVVQTVTRTHRSPRELCGTRYVLRDGSTVPLHRDADGTWSWPGIGTRPADLLPWLVT